jgi:hypothetical protein
MFNQSDSSEQSTTQGSSMWKKLGITLIVLLLLAAVAAAGYYYRQYNNLKKNPNKVAQDETKATIDAVAKLIVLPVGEQPTVATVTDASKLKDQAFFANARTGDKVLIYTNAKKAILYNPSGNKIVEVAPVNIGSNNAAANNNTSVSGATSTNTAAGTGTGTSTTPDTKK